MKKVTKEQMWVFYVDRGNGEEVIGTKLCKRPRSTSIWKMLQQSTDDINAYGYRLAGKQ